MTEKNTAFHQDAYPYPPKDFKELMERIKKIVAGSDEDTKKLLESADIIFERYSGDIVAKRIGINIRDGKEYSDRYDQHGCQVVDLVQEGGGMLGIALVGYTYIMEKAGLHFMSLAGTSAGGINTMMLAALPDCIYAYGKTKSEVLAYIIANKDFNDFIDRKGFVKKLIPLLTKPFFGKYVRWIALILFLILSLPAFLVVTFLFVKPETNLHPWEIQVFLYAAGIFCAIFPVLMFMVLFRLLLGENFGFNPGTTFKDWIREMIGCCGIGDTTSLYREFDKNNIGITDSNGQIVPGANGKSETFNRRIVLISANVTHNRIVKFPERGIDYWQYPLNVCPSEYVRATMSIPFFFEVYEPNNSQSPVTQEARFVDGGMLSNFPFREFHSTAPQPRFPTFGVKLELDDQPKYEKKLGLLKYLISFFSTFRSFYDNDFVLNNEECKMLVRNIDTKKANWLDFDMKDPDKVMLFMQGAQTACDHLKEFNWSNYKLLRQNIYNNTP